MFSTYRVTSPYGKRIDPITKKAGADHSGIDLVKAHKSPILAFIPGTVTHARMGVDGTGYGGYGNVVAIRDKNGNTQLYAHLDSISVKVGQVVTQGQEVGKQGTTGRSTGSHLHYEVRTNGTYGKHVDPVAYTQKYWEESQVANEIKQPDIGPVTIVVNGHMRLKGISINGVSMVPVSSIMQALGFKTEWDKDTKTVTVKSPS